MTICPGKKQSFGLYGPHNRDLAADIAAIEAWGAEILISLIETQEYRALKVEALHKCIPASILHLQMPIRDASVPDARWEAEWHLARPRIHEVLRRGGKVCLHCNGGLGRSGTIAARLLVEFGVSPDEAVSMVRSARPGAIETLEQERYIQHFASLSK